MTELIGTLAHLDEAKREAVAVPITFADAVKYFRGTHMKSGRKPTTRIGYNVQLDRLLLPRFGALPLESIDRQATARLDAELVDEGLAPSARARFHIVLRSVLRTAVNAGLLAAMPALPKLPKSGRKAVNPMRRGDLDAILAAASPSARLAFELATFAGLRAGEVRGLRWPDVDLDAGTLTIRRSISAGFETTPKSHHQRRIPMIRTLRAALEAARPSKGNPRAAVTITALGKPWAESGLNQAFKRAMERAELDGWSFHDLRHFFVSELFRMGASCIVARVYPGKRADSTDEASLASRARLPRTERRDRPRPFRRPHLARVSPPRHALLRGSRVPRPAKSAFPPGAPGIGRSRWCDVISKPCCSA